MTIKTRLNLQEEIKALCHDNSKTFLYHNPYNHLTNENFHYIAGIKLERIAIKYDHGELLSDYFVIYLKEIEHRFKCKLTKLDLQKMRITEQRENLYVNYYKVAFHKYDHHTLTQHVKATGHFVVDILGDIYCPECGWQPRPIPKNQSRYKNDKSKTSNRYKQGRRKKKKAGSKAKTKKSIINR